MMRSTRSALGRIKTCLDNCGSKAQRFVSIDRAYFDSIRLDVARALGHETSEFSRGLVVGLAVGVTAGVLAWAVIA